MSDIKLKHESSSYWAIKALEDMGANDIDICTQETNFIYGHVVTMAHEINELEEELTKANNEIKRLRELNKAAEERELAMTIAIGEQQDEIKRLRDAVKCMLPFMDDAKKHCRQNDLVERETGVLMAKECGTKALEVSND